MRTNQKKLVALTLALAAGLGVNLALGAGAQMAKDNQPKALDGLHQIKHTGVDEVAKGNDIIDGATKHTGMDIAKGNDVIDGVTKHAGIDLAVLDGAHQNRHSGDDDVA